jgi:uncharacterized membrane protein YgcG
MKIEEGNTNKTTRIDKRFSISLIFSLVIFMISGSAATNLFAATPPTVPLPSCTDPTGQNLPCMIIISTLPPPPNALQCQETSGQILPCSYTTQNLSNGEQIVAITVYVTANFVFTSLTVIKVVVHETTGTTGGGTGGSKTIPRKLLVAIGIAKDPIVRGNIQTISVIVSDSKIPSKKIQGAEISGEVDYASHKTTKTFSGITDSTGQMSPYSWPIGGNSDNGTFTVKVKASKSGYVEGFATKTFRVICKFATECGYVMINQTNSTIPNNMTNTTSTPPTNKTVAASGGKGPTCTAGNCTTGAAPPVDCTKNPTDPSCTQTLTPSITSPTTKTCPDGSVIDASATCPSIPPSTNPSTPSTPPSTPPSNNPSPPSDNGNPGGGSGSSNGGGSSSGGGSSPPQPSTVG